MSKHLKAILGQLLEESPLTLDELSRAVYVDVKTIVLLVDYQIIQPVGKTPQTWRFGSLDLHRAKKAIALQRDLEINYDAISIVLDLLDEIQSLQKEIQHLTKK
jgi:chaperone modulatory protein CbpM